MFVELKILAVGLLIVFLIPPIQGAIVTSTTSTSQPLTPILQTQQKVHTVTPGQFAQDLGSNTMQTTPKAFSFYRPGGNFSIGAVALTVNGQSIALSNPNGGLFPQGFFNSTTTEYLYDQTVAIFPNMYHAHLELYLNHISGTYNWEIILKGSEQINGFPVAGNEMLLIQFNNPQTLKASVCDSQPHNFINTFNQTQVAPACTSQLFGTMGMNWSNSPYPVSYNNSTDTVSYTVPSSFVIDPIALDGSGVNSSNSTASLSCSLTTSSTNDIIIVTFNIFKTSAHAFTGLSDTAGLTWTQRAFDHADNVGANDQTNLYYYYAKSTGTLSGDSITITTASATFASIVCYGVSGANFSSPFDPNGSLPADAHQAIGCASGTTPSVTFSTSNPTDFLVGIGGDADVGNPFTADSGWTLIKDQSAAGTGVNDATEYKVVSATQSGATVGMTSTGAFHDLCWVRFADAIQQFGVIQPVNLNTLIGGAPSATISISGCGVSNSTFTANGFKHTYSSVTASCTITLTEPADGANTRYRFNISPKPLAATSITFQTCASGTCSTYLNSTYYQVKNEYHSTPLTPSTWDGVYSWSLTAFTVGTSITQGCTTTVNGGGVVNCAAADGIFFDYGKTVTFPSPIGNTWIAQAPSSFTDTTGGNTRNVNYIQSKGGEEYNYLWLFLIPLGLIFGIFLKKRL